MKPVTWWQRNCVQGRIEVVLFWVLAILVAGFFVLLATAGWAEVELPQCEKGARNCLTIVLPDLPPQEQVRMGSLCEYKMETAMRRMQPYLGMGITMFAVTPEDGKLHDEMMQAKAYWDAVAKECWRQP